MISQTVAEWVEEGLIARGAEPPTSDEWTREDWVLVPPGTHLPFTKRDLITKLRQQLPTHVDASGFDACLALAGHLVHARAYQTLEGLKEDFAYFDPTATSLTEATHAELEQRERSFFSNLMKALVRGNFLPLSDDLYRKAIDQRFVLDVPIKVRWERLDETPIRKFMRFGDSPDGAVLRKDLGLDGSLHDFIEFPDAFHEKAFVFHRGLSPLQSKGTFVAAKFDIWLTRILRVIAYPIVWGVERYLEGPKRDRVVTKTKANDPDAWRRRWVRRLGLENLPLTSLFKESQLQEPAYREMVVVFRLKKMSSKLLEKIGVRKKPNEADDRPRLNIKIFRDIPLADSEIVFPENTPQMRTLDAVLLTITALAAAPALIKAFSGGGGGASLVIGIVLLTYVSKVVGQYMRARKLRMARMTQELYHKTRDNDVGVLQYLVDAGEEQDFKEIALVYGVMLREQSLLTEQEADERVEAFVREHFAGLDVDFEIGDALRKAVDGDTPLGLLERINGEDGVARYRARPTDDVYASLLKTWQNFALRMKTQEAALPPPATAPAVKEPQLAPVGSDG